jgi:hypothetical protein
MLAAQKGLILAGMIVAEPEALQDFIGMLIVLHLTNKGVWAFRWAKN